MVDTISGFPTVRYCDGIWHGFGLEGWSVIPKERIMSCIATHMQNDSYLEEYCSGNYFRSVRDNLASYNLCATPCLMPSWLDSGESADHWMAFSDGKALSMLKLAEVKAGLETGLEESEYMHPVSPAFFSKSFVEYPLEVEELADYLCINEPDLIPKKSWRCRGHNHTRIENELLELLVFSPIVMGVFQACCVSIQG